MERKRAVIKTFRLHGLSLDAAAGKLVTSSLEKADDAAFQETVATLIDSLMKMPLQSNLITKVVCEEALEQMQLGRKQSSELPCFFVFNAFELPRFEYCFERKKLLLSGDARPPLHGLASDKINIFIQRFHMILQRVRRSPSFATTSALQPVDFVKSSSSETSVVVLAMLTQLAEPHKWYLEDTQDTVLIDVSECRFHQGIFAEGCFVLAEGFFDDGVFRLQEMGMPVMEKASATRLTFGSINVFGGPSQVCAALDPKMQELESQRGKDFLVLVSDVWLDDADVLKKLGVMFSGYSQNPPLAFVFLGNFLSKPSACASKEEALKAALKKLLFIIQQYPLIHDKSRFLFVPGPSDPGLGAILPQQRFPDCAVSEFKAKVPLAEFCTNPCRVQLCTQELVFFRDGLTEKLCKHALRRPAAGDLAGHLCRTVLSQGHLSPLPLHVSPVYWGRDQSLGLYPLPDLAVLSDSTCQFAVTFSDCLCVSPGPFKSSGYGFYLYYPHKRMADPSKVP